MGQGGNCHSFTSRSVMTMGNGPDGRPLMYQETTSTTTAPGGVKETKKTVSDSRTGVKKMAIGHHIGERAHIMEREHNVRSGEQEERQEFINLDEGILLLHMLLRVFLFKKIKIDVHALFFRGSREFQQ